MNQIIRTRPALPGRQVMRSAFHPTPGLHRKNLPSLILGRISDDFGRVQTTFGLARFVVTTPEVRCLTRIDLHWCPDTPQTIEDLWGTHDAPANAFAGHALWLTKRGEPGLHGAGQQNIENLLGDCYHGIDVPQPGCLGYHLEAETCADELWGRLRLGGVDDQTLTDLPAGIWVLRAACDAVEQLSKEEWDRVLERFAVRVDASPTILTNEGPL